MGTPMQLDGNWECPYCHRAQTIVRSRFHKASHRLENDSSIWGPTAVEATATVCANSECKKMSLSVALRARQDVGINLTNHTVGDVLLTWDLLPGSSARPLPPYIPEPLRQDYTEACRIRDLSPKASATLARRVLQGMIRDFCKISRNRLLDEINALREEVAASRAPKGVHADTVDAIDHVRSIGNIGAHMEKDINVIVDVDPDEAQTLIGLLELLFDEWYIARQERADRLAKIGVVAANKAAAKLAPPQSQLPGPKSSGTL